MKIFSQRLLHFHCESGIINNENIFIKRKPSGNEDKKGYDSGYCRTVRREYCDGVACDQRHGRGASGDQGADFSVHGGLRLAEQQSGVAAVAAVVGTERGDFDHPAGAVVGVQHYEPADRPVPGGGVSAAASGGWYFDGAGILFAKQAFCGDFLRESIAVPGADCGFDGGTGPGGCDRFSVGE